MFCAGVYFPGRMAWWLPLGTLALTDIALNAYYWLHGWSVWDFSVLKYQLANYAAYVALIWLGRRFKSQSSFLPLLGGGVLGALLFYLVTNTASWLLNPFNNPEYTKSRRMAHRADQRHERLAANLGILSEHAFEQRAVHRLVCRGGETHRRR
jgi:hypothetical protein